MLNDVLPVKLPDRKEYFRAGSGATCELTERGPSNSLITRLEEDPQKNVERWKKLPYLMNFRMRGSPSPAR